MYAVPSIILARSSILNLLEKIMYQERTFGESRGASRTSGGSDADRCG